MQVDPLKPTLKPSKTKRLKLMNDELLSNFGFNFNLRRFIKGRFLRAVPELRGDMVVISSEGLVVAWEAGAYTRPLFSSI